MSYQRHTNFVMLGDLLISTPGKKSQGPLTTPSRFTARFPVSNLELSRLEQKIIVLRDTLAVAWAGDRIVARNVLDQIQNEIIEPYTAEEILSKINEMDLLEKEKHSVSFIFYAINQDDSDAPIQFMETGYLVNQTVFGENHRIVYAGSGSSHFLDLISHDFERHDNIGGSISELQFIISAILSRAAFAFYREMVSNENHKYYYGGGFELLVPIPVANKKRFAKISCASAFWRLDGKDPNGRDKLTLVGPILTNQYTKNNELVISRLHFEADGPVLHRFMVPGMFGVAADDSLMPHPDFDPFFVIHYVLGLGPKRDTMSVLVEHGIGNDKSMQFSLDKNGIFSFTSKEDFVTKALGY